MENRKEYIDKLSAQFKEWDAEIQKLEAKAAKARIEARSEYKRQIDELRSKRKKASDKLEDLRESGEEAWEELKSGAEKVFADMKNTFEKIASKFD